MPYRYLDDFAVADAAFEAWGKTPEEMIAAASDATLNLMVSDLDTVGARDHRRFQLEDEELDLLLFRILQELVYFKDAEKLLLRVRTVRLNRRKAAWNAIVEAWGEPIDSSKHDLIVDVKAITLYRLSVQQSAKGWVAIVVVDV